MAFYVYLALVRLDTVQETGHGRHTHLLAMKVKVS